MRFMRFTFRADPSFRFQETVRAEFQQKRKNKPACLQFLVKFAQRIEAEWEYENRRLLYLSLYRDFLLALEGHKDADCRELAQYGAKMKDLSFGLKHFLAMAMPVERKHTRGLRDHEFLIDRPDGSLQQRDVDSSAAPTSRMPLTLVLDNLRSAFNVGSVFRTAECLQVEKIVLCGYTATPEEEQTKRTAMGTSELVPWEYMQSTLQ
eukprot:gene16892-20069_t